MKTIYIKVPCSESTPDPDGEFYFTSTGLAKIDEDGQWSDNIGYVVHPKWWLEEKEDMVVMAEDVAESIFNTEDSWPLVDVLRKLIEASDILLHKKDCNGHGWEEHEDAFRKAKEILTALEITELDPNPEIDLDNDTSGDDCDDNVDFTCNFCEISPSGSHALHCPNNNSPFSQFIQNGYD